MLHQIGLIHEYRGEFGKALANYEESLRTLTELGERADTASPLHQIGMIHQRRGEYD